MIKKLLKYDLKWIYKLLIIFYVLSIIFSIIARICLQVENSLIFTIVGSISSGFATAMMVSSLINCIMRSWVRFQRNLYQDESYLTHTLPVSKKTLYLSKVLASMISIFTTTGIILISLAICYYSKENLEGLKSMLEITASTYNTTVLKLLCTIGVVFFLEMFFTILVGYTAIIIGHQKDQHKMRYSVILGFLFYTITQVITLAIVFIVGFVNKDVMNLINTTKMINMTAIKQIMNLGMIIYIIYLIVYYFIGKKEFEKGVNVD